ncbi:hypothetical protein L596_008655 [Steinernema carpocapsae]|uniref:Transglutaminase-like domain-containing protein n=1 Tax=Steinernema carpocapsae TaxID=34508 RepID=A0A4U5PE93_STECR|nr:hypothetical protein L596_008655 [Steinernema carpocapsae]
MANRSRSYSKSRNFDDWRNRTDGYGVPNRNYESLRVTEVDVMQVENSEKSKTTEFRMILRREKCLVLRRGMPFKFRISFDRTFDRKADEIGIVFTTGNRPRPENRSKVRLDFKAGETYSLNNWHASIITCRGNNIEVEVESEVDAIVGSWSFKILELKKGEMRRELYNYKGTMYMLFNPYHSDDPVYMEDKENLHMHFLKQSGHIYQETKSDEKRLVTKQPWHFEQFHEDVLEGTVSALMRFWAANYDGHERLRDEDRSDPVKVARELTYIIGETVILGKWGGPYSDGKAPLSWTGSVKILQEHHRTNQQVKYGQCWVFAGVLTSMLRTLGIPSRVVSNFNSAIDLNGDLLVTEKRVFDRSTGYVVDSENSEKSWNFHVWSEAWMRRRDLVRQYQNRYDGWQALSGTPEKPSEDCPVKNGSCHRCGPVPVAALRESNLTVPYDAAYMYAGVNADHQILFYTKNKWGHEELQERKVDKHRYGQLIVTDSQDGKSIDITNLYKPTENDKDLERQGYEEAKRSLGLKLDHQRGGRGRRSVDHFVDHFFREGPKQMEERERREREERIPKDVDFETAASGTIEIGDDIKWTLTMHNNSFEKRTVKITADGSFIMYRNRTFGTFFDSKFTVVIPPKDSKTVNLDIPYDSFESHLGKHWLMSMSLFAFVEETMQMCQDQKPCRVLEPKLLIDTLDTVEVGFETLLKIIIKNPYKHRELTDCVIELHAFDLDMPPVLYLKDSIARGQEIVVETTFTPTWEKEKETFLIVTFVSNELQYIKASKEIEIVGGRGNGRGY